MKKNYHEGGQMDSRAQRGCGNFSPGDGESALNNLAGL